MKISCFCFILLIFSQNIFSQSITICADSVHASLRGLSVVNNKIVWVSGSNGTVGKSVDGGLTWDWMKVNHYEKTDFRDIEAFDKNTAVIMGVSDPAYILRTTDGGKSWKLVYENKIKGIFLDAMDFCNAMNGVFIGDPMDGRFYMARTFDGGKSWQNIPDKQRPLADTGEACFASSGTNIRKLNNSEAVFISGGLTSHFFNGNKTTLLPIMSGKESTGANSIAFKNDKVMIAVGGDFLQKNISDSNCVITKDGGKSWFIPKINPTGYRSCVEYLSKDYWITCGLNGVDITNNDGTSWKNISKQSFNVCRKAKKGSAVFLAGNGTVGKLSASL